ncbi:hypothetical protein LOTGIDRAFT_164500 [Lottia gigantea]|uniref:ADF-H domain-containing protein n=1 Tax=Lottia gigantea TaxID=225164 RepID=V4A592_LOTGI|nr:hypothetical protein LOTGIDRAFT_164500 [Lottia gigantea]ESO90185.1 hypothetical protein LOTGIDRAFT_164500 [Lottia gigantea]
MSSGVGVDDQCIQAFMEIKMHHRYLYIIYKVSDDLKSIVIDEIGGRDRNYADFVNKLKAAENMKQCRYGVYDVQFLQEQVPQERLVFFLWSPEVASVRQKMVYSSSKAAFRLQLKGITTEMQCNDDGDLAVSNVLERCSRKYTFSPPI